MKYLYLVRHAKSSWEYNLDDFDRPLNQRGQFDAPLMGKKLASKSIKPDIIISSPASRAIKTATIIAEHIQYKKPIGTLRELYHASATNLLQLIKKTDQQYQSIMLFGHNPGLTTLANQLAADQVDNIPTCGIYAVGFDNKDWETIGLKKGKLLFYDYPKNHK
jgi:phosphohistidine phosphatase